MNARAALRFAATALALATALAPLSVAAQSGTFDLRPRATPTPAPPPVVGPVDPDNPVIRARPQAEPVAQPSSAPPLVVPTFTPAPSTAAAGNAAPRSAPSQPRRVVPGETTARSAEANTSAAQAAPASPGTSASPTPRPYVERNLDAVSGQGSSWTWALLAALLALLGTGGWLAWSRHFRLRERALPAPEIERPRLPAAASPAPAPAPAAAPAASLAPLELTLQATRMSATLVNTTLSYRLAVTNNGAEPLRDVGIAGDMIAAHASRPVEELLGPAGAVLPELHRIASLAPGESVTLGGDIRLPLVAITPIRKGNAALFVPLARLRARATDGHGAAVEGGGTFLVGQPGAAANARLQPFRLDLGPRNYSRLGQQRLPAHA